MGNSGFVSTFPCSNAIFLPYLESDHSPAVLVIPELKKSKPKPFKFANYLTSKKGFLPIVNSCWCKEVQGYAMFSVVSKLKSLKGPLRKLNREQGNLFAKVTKLKMELERIQTEVNRDSCNKDLRMEESVYLNAYSDALKDEELFLRQKSKVLWLSEGDHNSKYFHKAVKGRLNRNRIESINDLNGNMFFGDEVGDQFVKHFKSVLGTKSHDVSIEDSCTLFTKQISSLDAAFMSQDVSKEEIKIAMFNINDDKAPGPDGFSSKFFKSAWSIVGDEVCLAIQDFFRNGKLLSEVNATIIALVPKLKTPQKVSDFRPISCCNVIYKCISKFIANRLKSVLGDLVNECQSAFIPKRQISDNILLAQELLRNYHLPMGPPRCALKIDKQKAYDSVEWSFLESCLKFFGFPIKMVQWIMACVSSASFMICINGDLKGFFKGQRGLRQGDPMSPYLFTLVMEVFTLLLNRQIQKDDEFKFHWKCDILQLAQLCFADDLLLFCRGNVKSVSVLKRSLEEFSNVSGLHVSMQKSSIFFGNVHSNVQARILNLMHLNVGALPLTYLGVPLLSKRLYNKDCQVLIDKVRSKTMDWKNKLLSFAGRLQLISSVLHSMQVYWASMFVLPHFVFKEIEKLVKGFLWCHGDLKKGSAKVRWKDVCVPKIEGGLGLKCLEKWNLALISKHIWNVIDKKKSIWVSWIYKERLSKCCLWDCTEKVSDCWSWRKILQNRDQFRDFLVHKVGDGTKVSAWFDNWHSIGPLCNVVSRRAVIQAGFSLNSTVANVVCEDGWLWPASWKERYASLYTSDPPVLSNARSDLLLWKLKDGSLSNFSVRNAWSNIRDCQDLCVWSNIVWFSQCVPRNSFFVWLAIRNRLMTQDRLFFNAEFDSLVCPLCEVQPDDHDHLFFDCSFSKKVWLCLKDLARLHLAPYKLSQIIEFFSLIPVNKSIWSIIQRLVLGAAIYFIWQERNSRLFRGKERSVDVIIELIKKTVRLRLMGLSVKWSPQVLAANEVWDFYLKDGPECFDSKRL